MKIPLVIAFPLVLVSIQSLPAAAVRCGHADLSKLAKVVYVSPQGNDVSGCGQSATSPCKTIQQGTANCSGENCGVLVRYGVYKTGNPVSLADGVSLYGSCVFDETPYLYRSTVIGNPAIEAKGINKSTVIEGFVILGGTAVHSGEASVALIVSNSTGLVLRENILATGRGGIGANGNTPFAGGGQSGRYAPNSNTGGAGGVACSSSPPSGSTGKGGKGADLQQIFSSGCAFECNCSNNNYPASVGENGGNSGSVPGGAGGQRGSSGCACVGRGGGDAGTGPDGRPGNMGAASTQGGLPNSDTKGSFAGTIWRPNFGGTGTSAQVGSGGGGGGSGGFAALRGYDYSGFPGGGGGGGGCGGPGGTGAQQGGASVPLVLLVSSVAGLAGSNALIPGPGGQGGKGGIGARGGNGGSGVTGYLGQQYHVQQGVGGIVCKGTVPGRGGRGGNGGQGGAGSGGAGGNGGPSFGIAVVNSPPLSADGIVIYAGQSGRGGDLGPAGQNDAQNKGADGKTGLAGFSSDPIVSFTSTGLLFGPDQ